MKLLMENWRRYLKEEQEGTSWENWTIEQLEDLIKNARAEEDEQSKKWLGSTLGGELLKAIPFLGAALTGGEILHGLYKKVNRIEGESDDDPKDFPILDILDVDRYLLRALDQEILNNIDEKYQTYLQSLPPDTLIKDIIDINDFIRQDVTRTTGRRVTISDESGEN